MIPGFQASLAPWQDIVSKGKTKTKTNKQTIKTKTTKIKTFNKISNSFSFPSCVTTRGRGPHSPQSPRESQTSEGVCNLPTPIKLSFHGHYSLSLLLILY